ncbi:MAG TPA: DUF3810 domain-containing protein [Ferruginibacter sp.]|nr:DUF3810 domain-containing protein [Ferruginibacter sp.]HRE64787.1 DUF3810 domain-containing protein [Ferruginibacter sp.]
MKPCKKTLTLVVLLVLCVIIRLYSSDAARVEMSYSNSFYPALSRSFRFILGKIPLSVGDLLYALAFLYLAYKLARVFRFIYRNRKWEAYKQRFKQFLYRFFIIGSIVYIVFNIFWGINYNRMGIAQQLGLQHEKYSTAELREMNCLLIDKLNNSKRTLIRKSTAYPTNRELFRKVLMAYDSLANEFSFLKYSSPSIKSSMYGWLGNYTGFTGYYNPFSGEAQVNTTIPKFLQPYTSCHEVAHQIGYAKEMEANFVGYLAAKASPDTLFHYSVYLDLFTYANRNLFMNDSLAARIYRKELDTAVKADILEWRKFNFKHVGKLEPLVRWAYGKFLQSNQQPNGISSYDEVTGFLIAYYKKYKKI